MAGKGFMELMSFSFMNMNFAEKLGLPASHPMRKEIRAVANPLSEEQGVLRTTVIPSLLNSARLNQYHGQRDLRLFELSRVFRQRAPEGPPDEIPVLAGLLASDRESLLWNEERRPTDFFDLKGALEALASSFCEVWSYAGPGALGKGDGNQESPIPPFLDPSEAAAVFREGEVSGYLGLVKASVREAFGLKAGGGPVYVFELLTADLPAETRTVFSPFPGYPPVVRDLAVLVDRNVPSSELEKALRKGDYPLREVSLFDLYTGERLPKGKKSVAFRLRFQDSDRTLTEELVSGYFKSILATLEKEFGATLRV
jgi:phenylalanyl-tRNA synthetase beta chain